MDCRSVLTETRQLASRTTVFESIRRALHRIFDSDGGDAWDALRGAPTSADARWGLSNVICCAFREFWWSRSLILANAAKVIENSVQMMSATPSGYDGRARSSIRAIGALRGEDIIKSRARDISEDDDTGVMRALKEAVVGYEQQGHLNVGRKQRFN
jgi:hypothetical protein